MKIYTFLATDPDCPTKAIARIWGELPGAKGKTVTDWHPIIVGSVTPESARTKMQKWWDAQQAKEKAKAENIAAGVAKRMAKKGAPIDPKPVEEDIDVI